MSSLAEGLLEAARKDLGYREKSDGYTKFGDWYYANVDSSTPHFKIAPWCDMFIAWAANQAGVQDYVGEFAYTVDHANWFKKHGAWSSEPEPGALVFYDWSGSDNVAAIDHVGIVETVKAGKITTIEANVDGVWLKRKERDEAKVVGYGLPRKVQENLGKGKAAASKPAADPPAKKPSPDSVVTMQAVASMTKARQDYPATDAPALPEAAIPAAAVTALLCVALLTKRARSRKPSSDVPAGRHRRPPQGRHRAAAT
ncbi:CHAP domain-containing protein [Planomonospora parontospora]|uniref:CHAP domain-containing protein n=1 Tax=Planomonospora parontospora TaxID=58119 RepID=UPI0016703AA4|nr:CHAP domain-containing protein [Planomonospora parontospora]GGL54992.1 hypothetical protein GCM10014719_65400 [Planomonospora parontospora subsp. antibiotica]GII19303.1 hypothetical protein Ppa05_60290 [Planomonospora parontospora subsp. antibiotica]